MTSGAAGSPRIRSTASLMAAALALTAAPASAAEWLDWERWMSAGTAVQSRIEGPWRVNAGIGAALAPVYLGGKDYEAKLLPLLDLDYRNFAFLSTQRGLGVNLLRKSGYRAGLRITPDWGRDSADASRLSGLPDVDIGAEAGVFFEAFSGAWRFQGDLRQEFAGGHGGFLASAGVAYGVRASDALSLFLGANATYMGEDYADAYFSVPAGAPLTAFQADSGFRDVSPYAQLVYHFTPNFYAALDGRAYVLLGDAADSPIAETDIPIVGSFLIGYRF